MIRSMTGFARRESQGPWGTLVSELRTVNHRYLEISLRLPDDLRPLDNEVRQTITAALRRGKVDANLYLKANSGNARSIEIDSALLDELLARVAEVRTRAAQTSGGSAEVDPLDVLRWPGVIRDTEVDAKPVLAAALNLLREALTELNDTRHREGQRIRELLLGRCNAMRTQVQLVKERLPDVSQRLRDRIVERISQLGQAPDQERLEQELVMYAHKMDVAEELDRLAGHERHQGVCAQVQGSGVLGEGALDELLDQTNGASGPPLLLVLDGVQDPHNLGACLRTADAVGVTAVIVPRDRAAGLSPTVRKVASGAAETVPLIQVVNLARTLRWLKERNIWIVGTDDQAPQSLHQASLTGPLAVVLGAEGPGLRRLTKEHCDTLVGIPMRGVVESLNVSVATGVVLYEVLRQRGG